MAASEGATKTDRQLVVFSLASAAYGVDIGSVREIIRMQEITRVPNAPEFIEGVINLRGKICPVVDLRKRFEVEANEATDESRIVVVEIDDEDVGVIVDAVDEAVTISEGSIHSGSSAITMGKSDFLEAVAEIGDRLILLVALNMALSMEDSGASAEAEAAAA